MLKFPLAVTIDTNIFVELNYDIHENGNLSILINLVNKGKVQLFLSDIVIRETEKRLIKAIDKAIDISKDARKKINACISPSALRNTQLTNFLTKIEDVESVKSTIINNFFDTLNRAKPNILNSDGVDINNILNDYFNGVAPFETSENKKYEFPDALIIAKLKQWFSADKPLISISGDGGFNRGLESQKGYICLHNIKELFDLINSEDEKYTAITEFIMHKNNLSTIQTFIENHIHEVELDGNDVDRKGISSGYDYDEVEIESIHGFHFEFNSIDEINEEIITLTLNCSAKIEARCSFTDYENSIWDSEEKEYIFSQSVGVYEWHNSEFECVVCLSFEEEEQINFEIEDIFFDIKLDRYSRTSREIIEGDFGFDTDIDNLDY